MSLLYSFDLTEPSRISIEEVCDGKARIEHEHVWHAIADPGMMAKAKTCIEQEQYVITRVIDGQRSKVRVRRNNSGQGDSYELTIKGALFGTQSTGKEESTVACTVDMFNQIKWAADEGWHKKRCIFPVAENPQLNYEVDFFYDEHGGFHDWVKIDLEVPGIHRGSTYKLPEGLSEIISSQDRIDQPALDKKIQKLYDTKFNINMDKLRKHSATQLLACESLKQSAQDAIIASIAIDKYLLAKRNNVTPGAFNHAIKVLGKTYAQEGFGLGAAKDFVANAIRTIINAIKNFFVRILQFLGFNVDRKHTSAEESKEKARQLDNRSPEETKLDQITLTMTECWRDFSHMFTPDDSRQSKLLMICDLREKPSGKIDLMGELLPYASKDKKFKCDADVSKLILALSGQISASISKLKRIDFLNNEIEFASVSEDEVRQRFGSVYNQDDYFQALHQAVKWENAPTTHDVYEIKEQYFLPFNGQSVGLDGTGIIKLLNPIDKLEKNLWLSRRTPKIESVQDMIDIAPVSIEDRKRYRNQYTDRAAQYDASLVVYSKLTKEWKENKAYLFETLDRVEKNFTNEAASGKMKTVKDALFSLLTNITSFAELLNADALIERSLAAHDWYVTLMCDIGQVVRDYATLDEKSKQEVLDSF